MNLNFSKSILAISLTLFSSGLMSAAAQADDLKTVPSVDLAQYLGTWYQISRNVLFFEQDCSACSRQVLAALPDGTASVWNTCNQDTPAGKLITIKGTATSENPVTHAEFTIDFGLPHKGQYWIIGLAPDYHWAIVSDPSKKSLYILSKTPTLDAASYQAAVAEAATQLDTTQLQLTNQTGCTYPAN